MRTTYRRLAHVIAACVVVQVALIALGVFWDLHLLADKKVVNEDNFSDNAGFGLHAGIGVVAIPLLVVALLAVALRGHVPGGARRASYLVAAVVAQLVLAFAAFPVPVLGILHGINAFVVLGLAEFAARAAGGPVSGRAHALVVP